MDTTMTPAERECRMRGEQIARLTGAMRAAISFLRQRGDHEAADVLEDKVIEAGLPAMQARRWESGYQ